MKTDPARPQITRLLSNDLLSRIERLRLNPQQRLTNPAAGQHRSQRAGQSIEFRDYRDYSMGDDLRHVDWNIFARLRRPYVKLYHEEQQRHVVLLVDASSSMMFEDKLLRSVQLAAACGVMGLMAGERVTAHAFNLQGGQTRRTRLLRGRASLPKLFAFLESLVGGGDGTIDEGIRAMLRHHSGRGILVVNSDFLTHGDLPGALTRARTSGLETLAVQWLGPSEIEPELTRDVRLVDCETEQTLDISSAADLLSLYQEYRLRYQRQLDHWCRQRGGRFLSLASTEPIESVLFHQLVRRGWLV